MPEYDVKTRAILSLIYVNMKGVVVSPVIKSFRRSAFRKNHSSSCHENLVRYRHVLTASEFRFNYD